MKKLVLFAIAAVMTLSMSAQNLKFAYVNFAELVQLMPEADKARDQIATATKEAQDTYQSMMEEFQNKYQQYQAKSNAWTPAVRESKEKELTDIQQRIQEFQQSIQVELQQQQEKLFTPIQKKAHDVVEKLGKEGGYVFVFEKSQLLYVNESLATDLTPLARKSLNIPAGRTLESLQAELMAKQQQAATPAPKK